MRTIHIVRDFQDNNQTLGTCTIFDENNKPIFSALSLERGWRNNQNNVSCVPTGTYSVVLEYSNRFQQDLWELKNVPKRSGWKFHAANYWYQLNGCIALGRTLADLNHDGYNDVTSSKSTMAKFHEALKGYTKVDLVIKNKRTCNCM